MRVRHLITETDRVAQALDYAAKHWPEDRDSRAKLLLRLLDEGHRALVVADARHRDARVQAVRRTSGALTGTYAAGHLEQLREDWPV